MNVEMCKDKYYWYQATDLPNRPDEICMFGTCRHPYRTVT